MAYSSIKESVKKRKYNDNHIQYGFTTILDVVEFFTQKVEFFVC